MSYTESNLALESLRLFSAYECKTTEEIDQKDQEVNRLIEEMNQLQKVLGWIGARTEDSERFELSLEEQVVVDKLRANGLSHIFPPGKTTWKGKEIERLTQLTSQHIEGPLQRKIGEIVGDMARIQQEQTKIQEMFTTGLNIMRRLIQETQRRMGRG